MAGTFNITTDAPEKIQTDSKGHAQVSFRVSNATPRPARCMARAVPLESTKEAWLQIAGETDRDIPARDKQDYVVSFNAPVPQAAPAGGATPPPATEKYSFQLRVALATNPDEDVALSSPITVALPAPAPPPPPFRKWILIPIAAVLLIAIGLGLYFAVRKKNVQVPDVVGMTLDQANAMLSKAKLTPVQSEAQFTGNHQVGDVIAQDPKPDGPAVPKGTEVKLTTEAAEPTVEVPDVTKRLIGDAKARLAEKGLNDVETSTEVTEGLQVNQVASQDPAAGQQVKVGSTIQLVVAVQRQISVPDVTFRPANLAQQQITAAGLKFVMRDPQLAPANVAPGNIKSQNPAGGQKVPPDAVVELVAAAEPTTVPNVIGSTIGKAQIVFQQAGLELGSVFGSVDQSNADTVDIIGQSPSQGSTAARGSKVNVSVPQKCRFAINCGILVTDSKRLQGAAFRTKQP